LASCWVRVEPPCTPPAAGQVVDERAAEADRVDAEMLVEALVLDRDEGLWQIGRHLADGDGAPAGLAAIGEQRAVGGEDRDVGRPLRHGELVDRRQLRSVIGDHAAKPEHGPEPEHEAPIEDAAEEGAALAALLAAATRRGLLAARLLARCHRIASSAIGSVIGRQTQIAVVALVIVARTLERRLAPLSASFRPIVHPAPFRPHHAPRYAAR
jgi:hypothetical protein